MAPSRYRLDSTWRRPGAGDVVLAGSPMRLFRLSAGGAHVVAQVEAGSPPSTATVAQLLDRFVDAGALHPEYDGSPFTAADVTVVSPAYGRLPASPPGVERVVVVDDASPVALDAPAGLTFLRHDTNRGPGAARNTGLAEVVTPLVAFVDTDVELPDGWLDPLLAHFSDERVALVAPRIASGGDDTGPVAAYETRHSPLDLGTEPARVSPGTRVSYVPAAVIVCRTDAVRAVGGFDEALRFGEDVDLVWRLLDAGHRARYEPAVVARHRPRRDRRELWRQRFGYGSSAAPLASRHAGALAPVRMSGWSLAVWALVAVRRPFTGLVLAATTTALLVRKLKGVPPAESARLAALGHLAAGRQLAVALRRVWWPLALVGLLSRRTRPAVLAALVALPVIDAVKERSWQPLADAPDALADDVAYGAGVWAGVARERQVGPLLPSLSGWPRRGDR